ncbi:MAG: hypothetical protein ACREIV_13395, partial [Planctomycetaceae bacterium]
TCRLREPLAKPNTGQESGEIVVGFPVDVTAAVGWLSPSRVRTADLFPWRNEDGRARVAATTRVSRAESPEN